MSFSIVEFNSLSISHITYIVNIVDTAPEATIAPTPAATLSPTPAPSTSHYYCCNVFSFLLSVALFVVNILTVLLATAPTPVPTTPAPSPSPSILENLSEIKFRLVF